MPEAIPTSDPVVPPVETPPVVERPAWLPEGFDTPEALAAAYADLKTKAVEPPPVEPPVEEAPKADAPAPIEIPEDLDTSDPIAVAAFLQKSEVDLAAIYAEYAENEGKLTEDTLTSLEAKGYSRDQIVAVTEKLQKTSADLVDYIYQSFDPGGTPATGAEAYTKAAEWFKSSHTAAEVAQLNADLGALDPQTVKLAAMRLQNAWLKDAPRHGSRQDTSSASNVQAVVDPIVSFEDIGKFVADPRYTNDKAFRANIDARIKAGRAFR